MSWFTPVLLTNDERSVSAQTTTNVSTVSVGVGSGASRGAGLGSAHASGKWAWSAAPLRPARAAMSGAPAGASLRAPVAILSQMSAAAQALGRSESDIWVEAAREWLNRHEGERVTPPTPPAAPTTPSVARRSARVWDDIDALVVELCAPAATAPNREDIPAA